VSPRRAAVFDALGLLAITLVLADHLRPSLLLLPTITAGGDTPCHYPTAAFLHEYLLPRLRLHGWYAGAYLGHPLLLYYFPLPFLVMSALAPVTGMPVAFKLGTSLGVFLLPFCAYAASRLLGLRFPGPLFGAGATLAFLLVEENPIWGGTLASTLAGEFSYTYGTAFAVVFLGVAYRSYARGEGPWKAAAVLALTGLAHGYAVLWAGLSATFFLYGARRPLRTLLWLAAVAAASASLIAFWLLPLLSDWGWTTPFNDAWISVEWKQLFPRAVLPLFALAGLGLASTLLLARRSGGADRRLLYLWHAALVGAALAAAGPKLGIIDVRFLPFTQLALALAGAAAASLALERMQRVALAAAGAFLLLLAWADSASTFLRYWAEYNYSGLEAKELWPAWREMMERLEGGAGDPRVAVEYSSEHERAGSIRMYETLPFFTGRPTLEGVYNQASLNTHPVYYLASELNERSPNPFRNVEFSEFDTEAALAHLRLFATDTVVALSEKLQRALEARSDVIPLGRVRPYTLYKLKGPVRYVEPVACAPLRSPERGWRERALRWFTRKPLPCGPLVFSDAALAFEAEPDEWLAPPARPLEPGVNVRERLAPERIDIHTDRVGHPLLVKVSWHPRWRAEGADGPYRVSPALMLVVPRQRDVALRYAPNWADSIGRALSALTAFGFVAAAFARRRRTASAPGAHLPLHVRLLLFGEAAPGLRWGGSVPALLVLALFGARLLPDAREAQRSAEAQQLERQAGEALQAKRYEAAAEYARHALLRSPLSPVRDALYCLRGESLLAAGRAADARDAFAAVLRESPRGASAERAQRGLEVAEAASRRSPP
jgi:hypothetical protein